MASTWFTVTNDTRRTQLADRAVEARSFASRFIGWMGRSELASGEGLHIVPCNGVHTFFMRLAIDVLILDAEQRVLKVFAGMRPWRLTPLFRGARSVLELPSGTVQATQTAEGDQLAFSARSG